MDKIENEKEFDELNSNDEQEETSDEQTTETKKKNKGKNTLNAEEQGFGDDVELEKIENPEDNLIDGHHYGGVKEVDLSKEMRTSFLNYAMSVIVSRALPDVRDGMKPVHRRILYVMNDLGVGSDKPYKKSARIVIIPLPVI